jgi:hypothetical protein
MVLTSLNRPGSAPDENKYPALQIVLLIWKLLVVVWVIACVGVAVVLWKTNEPNAPAFGLAAIVAGLGGGLVQWANIELIQIFIDIEENTRRMTERV